MKDAWRALVRQELQEEIDEAEETLESIKREETILIENEAKAPYLRIGAITDQFIKGGLTREQEDELTREMLELFEHDAYLKLRSYQASSMKAYEKLYRAKRTLKRFLAEEAPPIAPPAASSPLPSSSAQSKFIPLYCSNITDAAALYAVYG